MKCRVSYSSKIGRGSVHWQHPEIPTTITEGHVLLETEPEDDGDVADGPHGEGEEGDLVSRNRSHSLPAPYIQRVWRYRVLGQR